ncbi:mediator of RNA polymerase II transcription subunit 11 isoform X2 [Cryptomeria japonica]|uniref:mediator of RNA polymerase II transcription subunit 11 isoform X2 n=1 Tax=Cryptomeria japonica TaxID=3369 RepID=UPI0025ABE5CC|nr:mediator of RNA polymerase II transcription subunit 11 isoform X2 [Cryptomeria japonica]
MASPMGGAANPINTTAAAQSTSLQRLYHVEKRIVHALELAGGVMEELANASGPKMDGINANCREFMQSIKDIQVTLREEIKSMCEYRPFENCDYVSRTTAEISCKKLDCVVGQLDDMETTIKQYNSSQIISENGIRDCLSHMNLIITRDSRMDPLWRVSE